MLRLLIEMRQIFFSVLGYNVHILLCSHSLRLDTRSLATLDVAVSDVALRSY